MPRYKITIEEIEDRGYAGPTEELRRATVIAPYVGKDELLEAAAVAANKFVEMMKFSLREDAEI